MLNDVVSNISTSIKNGTSFGKKDVKYLGGFKIKVLSLLIPGILLGHYVDQIVNKMKRNKVFGEVVLNYIILQTIISMSVIYLLFYLNKSYTNEFQNTYAGLFFVSLYFGMQTNYVSNLQKILGEL